MSLEGKVILGKEIFSAVSAHAWDRLANGGITRTPFQTLAYQRAWWENLGRGELVSVSVTDGDQLVGLGVFLLEDGVLQFNASMEETDYLDILALPTQAENVWQVVIDCLCNSSDCPEWHTLDCWNFPADSESREILPRLAQNRGFSLSQERAEVCPVIKLEGDFDTYLAGIDKKQRGEIRRKVKKAAGAGVEIEIIDSENELDQAIDDFLSLLQSSTADKEAWLDEFPARAEVFRTVAKAALDAGTLLLMFTNLDGQRISALFNFVYDGRVWVYNSGNDISQHRNLSLGWVLTAHAIMQGIERGCHTFDFMRGDETYKYRFGGQDTEIFRITLRRE